MSVKMNQKLENVLRLALETNVDEREQSDILNVGYDESTQKWELIVKYHGSLDELNSIGVVVEYLILGYAILIVPENLVERVAEYEQIEYVEKPKRYYYSRVNPTDNSCIRQLPAELSPLRGSGVIVAVLDSGIDYYSQCFRKRDGSSRILFLWDQTLNQNPDTGLNAPAGFSRGVEFSKEQIDRALAVDEAGTYETVPSIDVSGHGTAVAGIAAGSLLRDVAYSGVAPESNLIIVKLGRAGELGFPRTTEIMRGVTYVIKKAASLGMPLVINLSFGNNYGAHDGTSLLERFLDNAAEIGKTVICVGSGNEADAGGHLAGDVNEKRIIELAVANFEATLNVQIWKNYNDTYRFSIISPGGIRNELPSGIENGKYELVVENTRLLVYFGEPLPYSVSQEIYIDMIPFRGNYINSGVWTFLIEPVRVVTGKYYLYISGSGLLNTGTGFYEPTPDLTLTIPSTASKVITVGAYDTRYDTYATFSGRGYAGAFRTLGVVGAGLTKPDLVAPGVGILAPDLYGGFAEYNGTSFATPIVSGSAALLMEWGIVRGNDPFLYGEKVKAYLRKGAEPLRGENDYPNDKVGFGKLCVSGSFPNI